MAAIRSRTFAPFATAGGSTNLDTTSTQNYPGTQVRVVVSLSGTPTAIAADYATLLTNVDALATGAFVDIEP